MGKDYKKATTMPSGNDEEVTSIYCLYNHLMKNMLEKIMLTTDGWVTTLNQ